MGRLLDWCVGLVVLFLLLAGYGLIGLSSWLEPHDLDARL